MRLIVWIRSRTAMGAEDGYTMIAVIGAISLVSILAAASLGATNNDINLLQHDLDRKRAHAAAQAGIADYSFHLSNDSNYWTLCTNVPGKNEPGMSAVNQVGEKPLRKRQLPDANGEEYAIELVPATGQSKCDPTKAVQTMIEQSGIHTGSFRIRSTGFVGDSQVSLVATYKRSSLLDYVYFTRLETMDPVTYWTEALVDGAYEQCIKFRREGREDQKIPGTDYYCIEINFISGDEINGPLHTNDSLLVCGTPTFGRTAADVISVSAGPPGYKENLSSSCDDFDFDDSFVGPLVTSEGVLEPPPSNIELKAVAGPSYTYTGQTRIMLDGNQFRTRVGTASWSSWKSFPASGVIYVKSSSCSVEYSPYMRNDHMYPSSSGCGNALVEGDGDDEYTGKLTIAAENDIIIMDDIERDGDGLLGLVANNFVRVYHPLTPSNRTTTYSPTGHSSACNGTSNASEASDVKNIEIDAAILAINHSFIVDHFNCGSSLGTLHVNGAISQKFRGTVGQGNAGYIKDYVYDDRLRYIEPPSFLDPVQASWHIRRETLDFPDLD